MKKLLSILMVLTLVMSLGLIAFAEGETPTYTDAATATFTVTYTATNGGTQPEETFTFTDFTCTSVTDAADGVSAANAPVPAKIADITLNSTTTSATATINLPTYTSVGVYTYTFKQNVSTTAGVVYYKEDAEQAMSLVVTVIEGEGGKLRIAAVHVEAGTTDDDKTGTIANTYESGTLAVTKAVTGNLGDKSKYFDVTVTFAPASGETINSVITYIGGKYAEAVTVANNTATIQVKDGDTVTFINIPEGVTWTVAEADYTGEGYDEATYASASTDTIAAGDADTCKITNNKTAEVDTGIALDSLPYILLAVLAFGSVVVLFARKRRSAE